MLIKDLPRIYEVFLQSGVFRMSKRHGEKLRKVHHWDGVHALDLTLTPVEI